MICPVLGPPDLLYTALFGKGQWHPSTTESGPQWHGDGRLQPDSAGAGRDDGLPRHQDDQVRDGRLWTGQLPVHCFKLTWAEGSSEVFCSKCVVVWYVIVNLSCFYLLLT